MMFGTPNYNYGYPYTAPNTSNPRQSNGIVWVSGIEGANSYLIGLPNQSVFLMDSEANTFYIKMTDQFGKPMPLRIFDYKERVAKNATTQQPFNYITREEFEKRLEELSNAKQPVQPTEQ